MPQWEPIVKELGPALLRYFVASFPRQVASDLVQETLIRLVRKSDQGDFDPQRGTYKTLAFGIAHYVRLEYLKTHKPYLQLNDSLDQSATALTTDEDYSQKEASWKLKEAILQLKEEERQILLLLIEKDLSLKEIALIVAMPEGTVKSHVSRAKENLKNLLEGVLYDRPRL